MIPTPSPAFLAITRNPELAEPRRFETAKEIAYRIRKGVKAQPIVERAA